MHLGRTLLIALAAAAIGCSAAVASPGKLIDKASEGGTPITFAKASVNNPRALLLKATGKPAANLEVLSQVTCVSGAKEKAPTQDFILKSGQVKKLKKGFKRPDDCTVDVQAAYDDAGITGTVTLKLYARLPR